MSTSSSPSSAIAMERQPESKQKALSGNLHESFDEGDFSDPGIDSPLASPPPLSSSSAPTESVREKHRLFGRKQPLHVIFGGGKLADLILWRNGITSAKVLAVATAVWVPFELLGYNLMTIICHSLIFTIAMVFLWSNASAFINKTPPQIPYWIVPEEKILNVVLSLRHVINRALSALHEIALGQNLSTFFLAIAGLWLLSVVGKSCSFMTLVYAIIVILDTVPALYEKYEDQVDTFGEYAVQEIEKKYAIFDAKVLSKIPTGSTKVKKN